MEAGTAGRNRGRGPKGTPENRISFAHLFTLFDATNASLWSDALRHGFEGSVMNKKYKLPLNHYDYIKQNSGWLTDLADDEANTLGAKYKSITNIDTVDSDFKEQLKNIMEANYYNNAAEYKAVGLSYTMAYHAVLNFAISGKKVFYPTENLIEQLSETELSVDSGTIETPFPTCLFVYQGKKARELFERQINKDPSKPFNIPLETPISVFVTLGPKNDDGQRSLILMSYISDVANRIHYATVKRELILEEGRTLEQALATDWKIERAKAGLEEIKPLTLGEGLSQTRIGIEAESFYTDGLQYYRLVLNTILYLSSESADTKDVISAQQSILDEAKSIKQPSKRKSQEKFAKKFSPLPYILIGEHVGPIEDRSAGDKGSHASRVLVRGHYKSQAHGPQRASRKRLWIAPYFRGPDMGELVSKPYVVR